jgi:hypothetical protein
METTTAKKHEFKFSSSHDNYLVDVGDLFLFNGFPSLSLRKDCKPYESPSTKSDIYAGRDSYPYVELESLLEASKVSVQVINRLSSSASEDECKSYESSSVSNNAYTIHGTFNNIVIIKLLKDQNNESPIFLHKQDGEAKEEMKTTIESYLQLEENWDGYGAFIISKNAVQLALKALPDIPSDYFVFPTKVGGVGFQSPDDKFPFLILKINPDGQLYSYLEKEDGHSTEKTTKFSLEMVAKNVAKQTSATH